MKRISFGIVGFLACPCHVPLDLALLGGTTAGGVLAANKGWLLVGMGAVFVVALIAFVGGGSPTSRPNLPQPIRSAARVTRDAAADQERHCCVPARQPLEVRHESTAAHQS